MKSSRSEFITVRGLRYHVRHWGSDDAPKLFMLHGWMDVSASFQFVVDCLQRDWHVIAPDWRGFGLTDALRCRHLLVSGLSGRSRCDSAALLAGRAGQSAGPQHGRQCRLHLCRRAAAAVSKLVNLEGFGLPATTPEQAPGRYANGSTNCASRRRCAPMRSQSRSCRAAAEDQSAPDRRARRFPVRPLGGAECAGRLGNPGRSGAQAHQPAAVSGRRSAGLLEARSLRRCCGWKPTRPTCGAGWDRRNSARVEIDRRISIHSQCHDGDGATMPGICCITTSRKRWRN